jgi:hypothetical protein
MTKHLIRPSGTCLGCRPFSAEKEPLALSPGAPNPLQGKAFGAKEFFQKYCHPFFPMRIHQCRNQYGTCNEEISYKEEIENERAESE